MRKRIVALLVATMTLGILVGCGEKKSDELSAVDSTKSDVFVNTEDSVENDKKEYDKKLAMGDDANNTTTEKNTEPYDGEDYALLTAEISGGITLEKGDIFVITYWHYNDDNSTTAEIKVDASILDDHYLKIRLPLAQYEIKGLKYIGTNPGIIEYGINTMFVCNAEDPSYLTLTIGVEATEKKSGDPQFLAINAVDQHILEDENGNPSYYDDRLAEKIEEEKRLNQ